MNYKLFSSLLAATFISSLANAAIFELDLDPKRTAKIKQTNDSKNGEYWSKDRGYYNIQDLQNEYDYVNKEGFSHKYNPDSHTITISGLTKSYLEKMGKKINLNEDNGVLTFNFRVTTKVYSVGKFECEPGYAYHYEVSIPCASLENDNEEFSKVFGEGVIKVYPSLIRHYAGDGQSRWREIYAKQ